MGKREERRTDEIPRGAVWVLRAGTVLAWCLSLVGFLGAMTLLEEAARNWFLPEVPLALGTVVLYWLLTVLIHESGHALAAHRKGMRLMRLWAGPLDIMFQRRGFRWRLAKPALGLHGFVQAYPDPAVGLRSTMLGFVLGGPVANLLAALLTMLLAWGVDMEREGFIHAFVLINGVAGIVNLIPMLGGAASDGMLLCFWGRHPPDAQSPSLAYLRLMSLSAFGTTADRLPPKLIDELDTQGALASLVVVWIRVKAAQNLGEWSTVEELERRQAQLLPGLSKGEQRTNKPLLALLGLELAFSRAMHEQRIESLGTFGFGKGVDWLAPHLRHRFAALEFALAGEWVGAEESLRRARRHAEASADGALAESESRIARHIRALEPASRRPCGQLAG